MTDDVKEQLRVLYGRQRYGQWSSRAERLENEIEMYEAWIEDNPHTDDKELSEALSAHPGIREAISGLRMAKDHAETWVSKLAEFSPKKKGKK